MNRSLCVLLPLFLCPASLDGQEAYPGERMAYRADTDGSSEVLAFLEKEYPDFFECSLLQFFQSGYQYGKPNPCEAREDMASEVAKAVQEGLAAPVNEFHFDFLNMVGYSYLYARRERRGFEQSMYLAGPAAMLVHQAFAVGVSSNADAIEFHRAAVKMLEHIAPIPTDCLQPRIGEILDSAFINDEELIGRLEALKNAPCSGG